MKRPKYPIIACPIEDSPLGKRALRFEHRGRYGGWTGYQGFGVISEYRYYGWAVTCWATVMAAAYDDGRVTPCFDHFDDAVAALFCFMDLAERHGYLREAQKSLGLKPGQRVPYFKFPQPKIGGSFWWRMQGLETIHDDFDADSRMMWSPARIERIGQRHNETTDPKVTRQMTPAPIMGWHG